MRSRSPAASPPPPRALGRSNMPDPTAMSTQQASARFDLPCTRGSGTRGRACGLPAGHDQEATAPRCRSHDPSRRSCRSSVALRGDDEQERRSRLLSSTKSAVCRRSIEAPLATELDAHQPPRRRSQAAARARGRGNPPRPRRHFSYGTEPRISSVRGRAVCQSAGIVPTEKSRPRGVRLLDSRAYPEPPRRSTGRSCSINLAAPSAPLLSLTCSSRQT
jgi:hypothetical protein